jgi:hypothetical protein
MENETLKVLTVDAITGKQTLRDFTDAELADNTAKSVAEESAQASLANKAAARASALAKLADLGLTAEEIAAL